MGNFPYNCSDCRNYKEKEFLIVDDKRHTTHLSQRNLPDNQSVVISPKWKNSEPALTPARLDTVNTNMNINLNFNVNMNMSPNLSLLNLPNGEFEEEKGNQNLPKNSNDSDFDNLHELGDEKKRNSTPFAMSPIRSRKVSNLTNLNTSKPPLEIINELIGEFSKDSMIMTSKKVLELEQAECSGKREIDRQNTFKSRLDKKSTLKSNLSKEEKQEKSIIHMSEDNLPTVLSKIIQPSMNDNANESKPSSMHASFNNLNKIGEHYMYNNDEERTLEKKLSQIEIEENLNNIFSAKNEDKEKIIQEVIEKEYVEPSDDKFKTPTKEKNKNSNSKSKSKKNSTKKITTQNISKYANDPWRSLKIFTIISENKLLNSNDFEILMQGEIFKYSHPSKKIKSAQLFSSKFCVLTKSDFIIHRTKESFLRMQNPIMTIPLHDILSANLIKYVFPHAKGKEKYFKNFYLELKSKESQNQELFSIGDSRISKINTSWSKMASQSDKSKKIIFKLFLFLINKLKNLIY
jgi:hypothetical protein